MGRLVAGFAMILFFSQWAWCQSAEEAQVEWQEFVDSNKTSRLSETSFIYYDTALRLYSTEEKAMTPYMTRHQRGRGINKINRHDKKPENVSEDRRYLGYVGPNTSSISGYSYYDENGKATPLVEDKPILINGKRMALELKDVGDDPYVKVYNYDRPYAELYRNPEFYDYNPEWRVKAYFIESREELDTPASNGERWEDTRLGFIHFQYRGQKYKVAVYEYDDFDSEDEDAEVQIRYADSPESESYPGGRYLYAKIKDLKNKDGFYLDFNLSHDPPCANSQAYNCSLPRMDERLDVIVNAGRKFAMRNVY